MITYCVSNIWILINLLLPFYIALSKWKMLQLKEYKKKKKNKIIFRMKVGVHHCNGNCMKLLRGIYRAVDYIWHNHTYFYKYCVWVSDVSLNLNYHWSTNIYKIVVVTVTYFLSLCRRKLNFSCSVYFSFYIFTQEFWYPYVCDFILYLLNFGTIMIGRHGIIDIIK